MSDEIGIKELRVSGTAKKELHQGSEPGFATALPEVERRRMGTQGRQWQNDSVFPSVHVIRGSEAILRYREMLLSFSERCGQPGTMEDLTYFLSKPGLLKRVPSLFLVVNREHLKMEELRVEDLVGALFLYEYSLMGLGLRAFATNDRSGRGTMLALPFQRLKVAAIASRVLLDRGAHVMMLSFRVGSEAVNRVTAEGPTMKPIHGDKEDIREFQFLPSPRTTADWTQREREIPGYLALKESYDATLAGVGVKTRRNLRYYRRRAEAELGCTFVADVEIGEAELKVLNRECMYPVADRVALWRFRTMKDLMEPVIVGVKDKDGRWLSLLGGRRYDGRMEILWQMNRDGLNAYSLSTVMRSYCIDQEVERGTKRLYLEGGTPHSLHHSFVREELMDLVVMRRSWVAKAMRKLVTYRVGTDNELADILKSADFRWEPC